MVTQEDLEQGIKDAAEELEELTEKYTAQIKNKEYHAAYHTLNDMQPNLILLHFLKVFIEV